MVKGDMETVTMINGGGDSVMSNSGSTTTSGTGAACYNGSKQQQNGSMNGTSIGNNSATNGTKTDIIVIPDATVECPLCMENLDIDDLDFFPCSCCYQVCRFCWHRLKNDDNGLCPACRQPYPDSPIHFSSISIERVEELKKMKKKQKEKQKLKESNKQNLSTIRVVQKNLLFVIGIPSRFSQEELRKEFSKYGKIIKMVINATSAYVTYTRPEDAVAAIKILNDSSQQQQLQNGITNGTSSNSNQCNGIGKQNRNGIQAGNQISSSSSTPLLLQPSQLTNSTLTPSILTSVKASLGTTKYCTHWLRCQTCPKQPDCMYLHEMAEPEASFTKEEMQAGKHTEYEKRLIQHYLELMVERERQQQQNSVQKQTQQQRPLGTNSPPVNGGGGHHRKTSSGGTSINIVRNHHNSGGSKNSQDDGNGDNDMADQMATNNQMDGQQQRLNQWSSNAATSAIKIGASGQRGHYDSLSSGNSSLSSTPNHNQQQQQQQQHSYSSSSSGTSSTHLLTSSSSSCDDNQSSSSSSSSSISNGSSGAICNDGSTSSSSSNSGSTSNSSSSTPDNIQQQAKQQPQRTGTSTTSGTTGPGRNQSDYIATNGTMLSTEKDNIILVDDGGNNNNNNDDDDEDDADDDLDFDPISLSHRALEDMLRNSMSTNGNGINLAIHHYNNHHSNNVQHFNNGNLHQQPQSTMSIGSVLMNGLTGLTHQQQQMLQHNNNVTTTNIQHQHLFSNTNANAIPGGCASLLDFLEQQEQLHSLGSNHNGNSANSSILNRLAMLNFGQQSSSTSGPKETIENGTKQDILLQQQMLNGGLNARSSPHLQMYSNSNVMNGNVSALNQNLNILSMMQQQQQKQMDQFAGVNALFSGQSTQSSANKLQQWQQQQNSLRQLLPNVNIKFQQQNDFGGQFSNVNGLLHNNLSPRQLKQGQNNFWQSNAMIPPSSSPNNISTTTSSNNITVTSNGSMSMQHHQQMLQQQKMQQYFQIQQQQQQQRNQNLNQYFLSQMFHGQQQPSSTSNGQVNSRQPPPGFNDARL